VIAPDYTVPRVALPDATEAEQAAIAAVKAESEWYRRTQRGFLNALFIKTRGRPFTGKPKRKPRLTKHQKHVAAMAVRAQYLRGVA
jgi:hypothetical protein